jgi:predicted AlkP superfamily phosphohydrolase/phosphomutase
LTNPTKVLFIGIDAADKHLILQWARGGLLPTFRSLLDTAAWGSTTNPFGLYVGAVWPSFYTGLSPDRHSRYCYRQLRPGSYDIYDFRPTHVRGEPFWDTLSRANKRVAVIDVPKTYPSPRLNGIHIVDWAAHDPDSEEPSSTPAALAREVVAQFGRDPIGNCNGDRQDAAAFIDFRDALIARAAKKMELSRHFLAQGGWDCFMTVFAEAHCVGHQCWHLHDAQHPRYAPDIVEAVGDPIRDVYIAIDSAIGELAQQVGPDVTVIVLASHGMGPHYGGTFLLDQILERLEGIQPRQAPTKPHPLIRRVWNRLPRTARKRLERMSTDAKVKLRMHPLSRRKSFQVPNNDVYGGIRINLVGREPTGCIRPGIDYDNYCEKLRRDLLEFRIADTRQPLVKNVYRADQIYHGECLAHLPDLLVEWNWERPIASVYSPKTGAISARYTKCRTGDHQPEGLFFIRGPNVKSGPMSGPVSVTDFAPTIAQILGIDLPRVDGKSIADRVGFG